MSEEVIQDESSDFVCESEDTNEVVTESKEDTEVIEQDTSNSSTTDTTDATTEAIEKEAPDSDGDNSTAVPDKAKKSNGVQKRIDKVVREREDEKRKNESLQSRIDELENTDKQSAKKEPVESDFASYDQYLDAIDEYDKQPYQDAKNTDVNQTDNEKGDDDLTSSQKTALAITQERVNSADKPSDFEAVALNPDLSVTGEMLEALSECDDPAKVMYHLGQNKELAAEIASKSPSQQMRSIVKLDMTVASKPSKPTNISNAPDAIDPVNGTDSQAKSHHEMSFSEFEAADKARNSKRKSSW
jgi:hypothetical protein